MTETPDSLPEVTGELLAELELRYAVPRCCRVCGAPLQVADTRGMKMACTSDAASPLRGKHEAAGATWKEALDHYNDSVMYDPPEGDRRVLALVAEVRRLRGMARPGPWSLLGYDAFEGEWYSLGTSLNGGDSLDGLQPSYQTREAALEGARRRLADLELTQPSGSSGGQSGIQDQVFILHPGGRKERVTR